MLPEPERAGPSRLSGAGRDGGAMWFMYVLSWLSLLIQVSFITLAVGESARPWPARAPTPASVLSGGLTTRVPERPETPSPVRLASASLLLSRLVLPLLLTTAAQPDRGSFQVAQSPPQQCPGAALLSAQPSPALPRPPTGADRAELLPDVYCRPFASGSWDSVSLTRSPLWLVCTVDLS